MPEYILLMHDDVADEATEGWGRYLERLNASGSFRGGSAIGKGICVRRDGSERPISIHLKGFIRIDARDMEQVRDLLDGNPVFEAGGTIEIRELYKTD